MHLPVLHGPDSQNAEFVAQPRLGCAGRRGDHWDGPHFTGSRRHDTVARMDRVLESLDLTDEDNDKLISLAYKLYAASESAMTPSVVRELKLLHAEIGEILARQRTPEHAREP